jgi:hypothetical protein
MHYVDLQTEYMQVGAGRTEEGSLDKFIQVC